MGGRNHESRGDRARVKCAGPAPVSQLIPRTNCSWAATIQNGSVEKNSRVEGEGLKSASIIVQCEGVLGDKMILEGLITG